ncbi:methyltransferase domain-containing protein, partial [PVC group bacterium]|nr:methyltransferase domain-containing protein [PVC group bacterium]
MHTGKYNTGFLLCLVLLITGASFVPGVCAEDQSRDERYTASRHRMVKNQIEARDIRNPDVLEAMKNVPRHRFLTKFINQAYEDHPVPIGHGQTISQPYIVGLMTQELELTSQDRVLEIGTGSGYQAAILAYIVKEVYTIEIIEELAGQAEQRLQSLKYDNIHVLHADGYFGWE